MKHRDAMTGSAQRRTGATPLVLCALLVVGGCVWDFRSQSERTTETMNAWIGHPVDDLILRWGVPSASAGLSLGRRALTWQGPTNFSAVSVYGQGAGSTFGSARSCRRTIIVDSDDRIIAWSFESC